MNTLKHTKVNLDHLASPLEDISPKSPVHFDEEENYSWISALEEVQNNSYLAEAKSPDRSHLCSHTNSKRKTCKIDTDTFFQEIRQKNSDQKKQSKSNLRLGEMPKPLIIFLVSGLICMTGISAWKIYEQASQLSLILDKNTETSLPNSEEKQEDKEVSKDFLTVYVSGAVQNPDIYQLKEGSRIADALKAAGGLSEEGVTEGINLAQKLNDGDQIRIPSKTEAEQAQASGVGKQDEAGDSTKSQARVLEGNSSKSKININTSSVKELTQLPGVGPGTAEKIFNYRESNGKFKHIDELKKVPGIGEKKYKKLADLICV